MGHTDDRLSPSDFDLQQLYESDVTPYYTPAGSKVTLTSAIPLLNRYAKPLLTLEFFLGLFAILYCHDLEHNLCPDCMILSLSRFASVLGLEHCETFFKFSPLDTVCHLPMTAFVKFVLHGT